MFKNKKVVIFDLDGTLIDSMGIWNRADESLIKKFTNKTVEEFFNDNLKVKIFMYNIVHG